MQHHDNEKPTKTLYKQHSVVDSTHKSIQLFSTFWRPQSKILSSLQQLSCNTMAMNKPQKCSTNHTVWLALLMLLSTATTITTTNAFVLPQRRNYAHFPLLWADVSTSQEQQPVQKNFPMVEFTDPITECQVVLLGCFHGTASSADDVRQVITNKDNTVDIVALELCQSRFDDLQKINDNKNVPWIVLYWQMVSQTIQSKGLPTGLAAAVLGGFASFQTALSGFQPGLEFRTAVEVAAEAELWLADQDVDETLQKIGNLPLISWSMITSPKPWQEWKFHSQTLQRAIFGNCGPHQIPLGAALTRNPAAIRDLMRLTLPVILLYGLLMSKMMLVEPMVGNYFDPVADVSMIKDASYWEVIGHGLASSAILALGYVGFALPAVRVILTERDEYLTEKIQQACHQAGKGGRVVAVLGMLHVNGIAQRMLAAATEPILLEDYDNFEG